MFWCFFDSRCSVVTVVIVRNATPRFILLAIVLVAIIVVIQIKIYHATHLSNIYLIVRRHWRSDEVSSSKLLHAFSVPR
tara:strand:+ start:1020 stop:1256 length:237 start_codon:yes stop_codon:yes gene_type:complete